MAKYPDSEVARHIERALTMFGTQSRLADAAGYSQNAITHALKVGRTSPALAMAIHKATYGRVSKHDLAPEIFGPRQTQRRRKMQSAAE